MNSIFHNILSVFMTFVVILSTLSFTLNMHYCGNTLVETALFLKGKGCGMSMQNTTTKGCSITKKNCCDDKQLVIEGQDELHLSFNSLTLEQHQFVVSFIYSYTNLLERFDEEINTFREYKPPLVVRQLYKIDETYLI